MGTLYTLNHKLVKVGSKFLGNVIEPSYPFESIRVCDQIWMAKNLNLKIGPNDTLVPVTEQTTDPWLKEILAYDYSNVYDDSTSPEAYRTDIGLQVFYSQQTAKAIADLVPGWHLPSYEEWVTLSQAPSEELLPFLATVYQIGSWNFNGPTPRSVQHQYQPYRFESVVPNYWSTREVTDQALITFYTARCYTSAVTVGEQIVSDPPKEEWTNLPVRLIKD